MKLLIFLLTIFSCHVCKQFTASDMHKLIRLSSAVVSPDGNYVVQEVKEWNNNTGKTSSYLKFNNLTNNTYLDEKFPNFSNANFSYYNPIFSEKYPNLLFFLCNAGGLSQVYFIDFPPTPASAPSKLTDYDISVNNLKIVGNSLVFSSEVYLDCESFSCTKYKDANVKERGSNTFAVYDKLFVRHWDKWLNDKISHIFVQKLLNLEVPTLSGKPIDTMKGLNANSPVFPDGDSNHFDISPDESEILFNCHFRSSDEALNTSWRLFSYRLNDTKPIHVTPHLSGRVQNPQYSPSGKRYAYLTMNRAGLESDKLRLEIYDSNLNKFKNITGFMDRSIQAYSWFDDNTILFTVIDFGVNKLYRVDINFPTSSLMQVTFNTTSLINVSFNSIIRIPSKESQKYMFSLSSFIRPTYLALFQINSLQFSYLGEIDNNKDTMSSFNLPEFESFKYLGGQDDLVQGWIMKPTNFNSSLSYPLAFLIHGGPESAWMSTFNYRWNPILWASRNYAVVMINFHGSVGQGQKYVDSIRGDMGGVPYIDLMKGLSFVGQRYEWVNTTNACAIGGSYGGYMVNWIQGQTDKFKCLVTHDGYFNQIGMLYSTDEIWFPLTDFCPNSAWGCVPWDQKYRSLYDKHSPESYVKNWKTPHLVIHGGKDYRIPITEALSVFSALQLKNIPSRLIVFPEENHWVLRPENSVKWYDEVLNWLDKYTGNKK